MRVRARVANAGRVVQAGEAWAAAERELVPADFSAAAHFELGGAGPDACTFTDYAPLVFRKLRELQHVNARAYMYSLGPERLLTSLLLGHLSTLEEVCGACLCAHVRVLTSAFR